MGHMKSNEIAGAFRDYYRTFPQADMNDLKLAHTQRVVENARLIMAADGFPAALRDLGEEAAWLHDLGRFRQFTQYHTFSDRESVNHALLSCAEALRLGWLDDHTPRARNLVLRAIECHNLRDLPPGLSADEATLSHLVRDADKLDIFTVLDEAIATNYLPSHPEVYWGLPFTASPSQKIVDAIVRGGSIDYADIHSFADFVFVQLAWCHGGLHFPESYRLAKQRGVVATRQAYLCEILPQDRALICRCCAVAEAALDEGANSGR